VNTSFADVGTTVYASNRIALATRKALDDYDPPTDAEMDLLEAQGYADSKRTVSRALGKMTAQGTVSTEKEGRVVRVRLLTHLND